MNAVIYHSYEDTRVENRPIPSISDSELLVQALASACKGGTLNIFAAHAGAVAISLETIYKQELNIISSYSSSPEDLRIARDLLASRNVRIDGLISHRLPLEQFHEGVALLRERAALKVYFQIAGEC